MEQNYRNHRRFYPLFHFILIPLIVVFMTIAVYSLIKYPSHVNAAFTFVSVLLLLTALVARMFALKAQDRAIRAEENLRYFALTGKLFPAGLRLGQIIALRFAHDDEFVALTERAVKEHLSPGELKRMINSWKGDFHRV